MPRQSVQLPGFEVPVGAEDEVEGVLALVGVPVSFPRPPLTPPQADALRPAQRADVAPRVASGSGGLGG